MMLRTIHTTQQFYTRRILQQSHQKIISNQYVVLKITIQLDLRKKNIIFSRTLLLQNKCLFNSTFSVLPLLRAGTLKE